MRILCYGDSNTYGYVPGQGTRYDEHTRWTGRLAAKLGEEHTVIEEGLNSRTTVIDDPMSEGKNGLTALTPCMKAHFPVDVMILMLGSNDMKTRLGYGAKDSAKGIGILVDTVEDHCKEHGLSRPKIIVAAPPIIEKQAVGDAFDARSMAQSRLFSQTYAQIASEKNCSFFDAGAYVLPSEVDGLHLSPQAHAALAEAFYNAVTSLF